MGEPPMLDRLRQLIREQNRNDPAAMQMWYSEPIPRLVFAVASFDWPPISELVLTVQHTYEDVIAPLAKERSNTHLLVGFKRAGSEHHRFFRLNIVNWKKLIKISATYIYISLVDEQHLKQFRTREIAVFSVIFSDEPWVAHTIQGHVDLGVLLRDPIPKDYQDRFVSRAKGLFQLIQGVNGFITVSGCMGAASVGIVTPLEAGLGLNYYQASLAFRERLRGCYWGNFLSRRHVELLGGEMAVQQAPVEIAEHLDDGGYYLQVTRDINDMSDKQLNELRWFLRPVLPKPQEVH